MAAASPWLRDFAGAWVFYSILPGWPWVRPRFERIARFAPWVGLVIAAIQSGVWWVLLALGWSSPAAVAVLIAMGLWLTGGLHVDGVMDTADGLSAGATRRLEAMEDSRVGASGVQAFAMVLILQVAALLFLAQRCPNGIPVVLAMAAFWGRCSPLWAVLRFAYLKVDGTAGFHRAQARGVREICPAGLTVACTIGAALLAGLGLDLALTLVVGVFSAVVVAESLGRRLGGHTGDSYGACVVWTETLSLMLLALLAPAWLQWAG